MTIAMLLTLHLICVALSVSLFVARYWWRYCGHALAAARWTRIVPPVIDTLLLLSGIGLIVKTHILPFTESGSWLTENCLALSSTSFWVLLRLIIVRRAASRRVLSLSLALVVLYIIIKLATTKYRYWGKS